MTDEQKQQPKPEAPKGQPEVMQYAVPAPILKAAIELIDEEINGKKGRRICNMLEQAPLLSAQALAAQQAAADAQ